MMSENSNQFSFLNKIKSLVAKTGRSLLMRPNRKENDISEQIALKIQKNSYDISNKQVKDVFTPPYLMIAEQLQVEDEQIFKAAVFNLTNIAVARNKFAPEIVELLNKELQSDNNNRERKEYVKFKLAQIASDGKRRTSSREKRKA